MLTITLPEQYVQIILQALGELPLKVAGPVFTAIQNQAIAQTEKGQDDLPPPVG